MVLRAYDRASRVFEAMSARGYAGAMPVTVQAGLGGRDLLAAFFLVVLLLVFYLAGQLTL